MPKMQNEKPILYSLSPDRFLFENYEADYSRLQMSYNLFPRDLKSGEEELVEALKRVAIGFCHAEELLVRPKNDMYAIMCEDDEGKFWFHVKKDTLKNNFRLGCDSQEAGRHNFMKPFLKILKESL